MQEIYIGYGLLALVAIFWYQGSKLLFWAPVLGASLYFLGVPLLVVYIYVALMGFLLITPLRTLILSKPLVGIVNKLKLLPAISDTEKTALRAGTVWMDGEIFSGKPNFTSILQEPYPYLTKDEQAFVDNEVNSVCEMTNDYETMEKRDLSDDVWAYLKEKKFFGMIIPKEYGGLGFSALGHSAVIAKLASHSQALAITTMVPNSLGPAELLMHYGTQDQRDHYLPRLAAGDEIPCFALTEPLAGSDATSIRAHGEVFKEGDEIKIRLNFEKRYITLGGVATLIGLAFTLRDPDNLLNMGDNLGITCALVRSELDGITIGYRHDPLGVPFINSPLWGKDVVIGIDDIIGAKSGIGQGWTMLMESLAVGRGISLPSTCTGGVKLSAKVCGAYSMVREQFGVSVGKFEGIETKIGHMAAMTYMIDGARQFTIGAIDAGKKPSVINAVMKYHSTELFRTTINDAMDIVGGAGVSLGERNLIGHAYMGAPIAITVEGANIMTRTLIQFGQGVIRCHPFAYKEIEALATSDISAFDKNFFGHVGFAFRNMFRSILLSLTRGYIYCPKSKGVARNFERKLMWSSATFAFYTDVAMGYFGGQLKQKEALSARFADILSYNYLLMATIRRYKEEGYKKEHNAYMRYIGNYCLAKTQVAYDELMHNIFASNKVLSVLFTPFRWYMKFNRMGRLPNDRLLSKMAKDLLKNSDMRDTLTSGVFEGPQMRKLEAAFALHEKASTITRKIKRAIRSKELPKKPVETLIELAVGKSIINLDEANTLKEAIIAKQDIVQVDSYKIEEFVRG